MLLNCCHFLPVSHIFNQMAGVKKHLNLCLPVSNSKTVFSFVHTYIHTHSCECSISKTSLGNFFKSGTNVHLYSRLSWLKFSVEKSRVSCFNHWYDNSDKICRNVWRDKLWQYPKSQRLTSLWRHLQKNVVAVSQWWLRKSTWHMEVYNGKAAIVVEFQCEVS